MSQPGDGLGLDLEADLLFQRGVLLAPDHLERNDTPGLDLQGLVDDAHAAAPQLAEDLVAGHFRHGVLGR